MAIIKGGGALSGLVGNVVIANYKSGKTVLRKAPRKRKLTEKQFQNLQRFSAVSSFWGQFKQSPIQQIWKVAEEGRRGNNMFINANAPAFSAEGVITDPERLHFSAGRLPLPHQFTAKRQPGDPQKVEVTWQDDSGKSLARNDDGLMIIVACSGKFTEPTATGATRKQKSAVITLPPVNGTIDAIWLYFASEKRKLYSPDQYFKI
jgi:hypothetical protein